MNKEWRKWTSREGVDLATINEIDKVFYDLAWNYTKNREEIFFTVLENRVFTHYTAFDHHLFGRHLYQKYLPDKKAVERLIGRGGEILKISAKDAEKWRKAISVTAKLRPLLIKALKGFVKQYSAVNRDFSIIPYTAIEAWQTDFQKMMWAMVERNNLRSRLEEISAFAYRSRGQNALSELRKRLEKGERAEKLVRDYQFLRSWSMIWHKPLDESWVLSLRAEKKKAETLKIDKKEIQRLLKPSAKEKKFLEIAPRVIYLKDWRDDLRRRYVFQWSFLFDVIAGFLRCRRDDLGYLTLEEISEALRKGKIDKNLIKKRKNNLAVVTSGNGKISMKILTGRQTKKYEKIIAGLEKEKEERQVSGVAARSGSARGRVFVVRDFKDVGKFKDGSILVANTTHPNYLPAMQKAAAIVTDEGGIASHAAIVAREMKIPCVVGAKIATKIFKDGDMVEVDAEKGIVRKIK